MAHPESRDHLSVSSASLCPEEGSRNPPGSLDIRVRSLSTSTHNAVWEVLGQGNRGEGGEIFPLGVIAEL